MLALAGDSVHLDCGRLNSYESTHTTGCAFACVGHGHGSCFGESGTAG